MSSRTQDVKKILIAGLPNTGKSLIFNNLTGQYNVVANSPLTTLTFKRGSFQVGTESFEVIDSPGLNSLYIHSEEQIQVRDLIFSDSPDVIIQCIDAGRLKQSLMLTADLLELGIPLVIALNAIDETARRGIWHDSDGLSQLLGLPVVETIAVQGRGTGELKNAAQKATTGKNNIRYENVVEDGISSIESELPAGESYKRIKSLLMLMGDPLMFRYLEKAYGESTVARLTQATENVKRQFKGSINQLIYNCRGRWIDNIVKETTKSQKITPKDFSQTFARLSRHPVYGIPILLAVIYLMFFMVVNVANVISEWLNDVLWMPVQSVISGILPAGFWHDLLIGDYGVLSLGLANALLTVLPILGVFFIIFNTLEDIGYIPNLSVLTKRILAKFGLSGGAIMPLVLGFGCKTMATLTTRGLRSKRERFIAVYLIAFTIPCAAQMGLNMSILGRMGTSAFVITFSVLTFLGTTTGIVLNKLLQKEAAKDAFILELPALRLPGLKGIFRKTYYRLYWFLKESLLVFVYAAFAMFTADKLGILEVAKKILSPLVEGLLGLPLAMVDAIILCFARHEAGAALVINLVRKGEMDYVQCIVAVLITTTLAPCFANIMAMAKEVGSKNTFAMLVAIAFSAFAASGALNWALNTLL